MAHFPWNSFDGHRTYHLVSCLSFSVYEKVYTFSVYKKVLWEIGSS